jgi:hypothetical protein
MNMSVNIKTPFPNAAAAAARCLENPQLVFFLFTRCSGTPADDKSVGCFAFGKVRGKKKTVHSNSAGRMISSPVVSPSWRSLPSQ